MEYTPYQTEQLVLGMLLRYPEEAPAAVLPELKHNRFIYNMNGKIDGSEHASIMQKITLLHQVKKQAPYPPDVKAMLQSADMSTYVDALVDMVPGRHRVYEFSYKALRKWASEVDRNGFMFSRALKAKSLGKITDSEDEFIKYVRSNSNMDVDVWASQLIQDFSVPTTADRSNYRHVSTLIPDAINRWRRQRSGEQLALLDSGIPILGANGLFPVESCAFVHGMSGGGKSAFVHQVNLGTAIGLFVNGVQGCVAINSLEMSYIQMLNRFAALLAGFNTKRFVSDPTSITDEEMQRLEGWVEFVGNLPLYIDDSNILNTSAIEYRVNSLHNTEVGPIWQLSLDYLGLLDDIDADNAEEKHATAARELFRITRLLKCSGIGISQSTFDGNRHHLAGLLGMRYSKGITHSADFVLEVYNPSYLQSVMPTYSVHPMCVGQEHLLWVNIQKDRNGGAIGWLALGWQPEYTRIYDEGMLGGAKAIFHHLKTAKEMMLNMKAQTIAVEDSYLGEFQ